MQNCPVQLNCIAVIVFKCYCKGPIYLLEDRYTITTSNDLNTSKIGSTAIFTYTAEPDGVGNPGPSVTRNVTIVGYSQIDVTSLTVSSDNSVNSSYAKAGDNVTITIETDGIIETIQQVDT